MAEPPERLYIHQRAVRGDSNESEPEEEERKEQTTDFDYTLRSITL